MPSPHDRGNGKQAEVLKSTCGPTNQSHRCDSICAKGETFLSPANQRPAMARTCTKKPAVSVSTSQAFFLKSH